MKCSMCGSTAGCEGRPIGANFLVARRLVNLGVGQRATVQRLAARGPADLRKLLALGLLPGVELEVDRRWPGFVLRLDYSSVALDASLAEAVLVS
jgi:Fe2+ transport system protein FeoA